MDGELQVPEAFLKPLQLQGGYAGNKVDTGMRGNHAHQGFRKRRRLYPVAAIQRRHRRLIDRPWILALTCPIVYLAQGCPPWFFKNGVLALAF